MFSTLIEMLSYTFFLRAILVGILVSLCASLLGVSLVLKRFSMMGDGLSHVGFGAMAVAGALNLAPMAVSMPIVILTAFLLLKISESSKIKGDAWIALISTGSLAIGITFISISSGMNIDVCNYMFGSILAMNKSDVYLSVILSIAVLTIFILFYNKIFAITFDESFSNATGIKVKKYNSLLAVLTAVTVVLGMRMMGTLLISSLIVFPTLTSMRVFKNFKSVVICSAIISVICLLLGLIMSYIYILPSGASIVLVNIFMFIAFTIIGLIKNR